MGDISGITIYINITMKKIIYLFTMILMLSLVTAVIQCPTEGAGYTLDNATTTGTNILDVSGNGFNATQMTGGTPDVPGILGDGYLLSGGANQYISTSLPGNILGFSIFFKTDSYTYMWGMNNSPILGNSYAGLNGGGSQTAYFVTYNPGLLQVKSNSPVKVYDNSQWHQIAGTLNATSNTITMWVDGHNISTTTGVAINQLGNGLPITINRAWDGAFYYGNTATTYDAIYFYNYTLTGSYNNCTTDNTTEICDLYNDGRAYDPCASPPGAVSDELNLILKNSTGVVDQSTILENTAFYISANWTNTTAPKLNGVCNFTGVNISVHFTQPGINTSLNSAVASVVLEVIENNNSLLFDTYEVTLCEDGTTKADVDILINDVVQNTIDSNIIPFCTSGNHVELINTTLNNGLSALNISVNCPTCGSPPREIKVVSLDGVVLHYERKYSVHNEDLTYNVSTTTYDYTKHPYEFTTPGTGRGIINITCNATTNTTILNIFEVGLTTIFETLNNVSFTSGLQVEASTEYIIISETFGDIVNAIQFNLTYENGTLIKSVTTENMNVSGSLLKVDGIYNLSIQATDDEGNVYNTTDYFKLNDTVTPVITWTNPVFLNTTKVNIDDKMFLSLRFDDLNLFAYQVLVYDSTLLLRHNFSLTNINATYVNFIQNITPDTPGDWNVLTTISDDHTKKKIKDYPYTVSSGDIHFYNRVDIKYITGLDVENVEIIKLDDRYSFKYNFDTGISPPNMIHNYIWQVSCPGIVYRPNSIFNAHFICPTSKTWLDFDADIDATYKIDRCENDEEGEEEFIKDCFRVHLKATTSDIMQFNSIGGLNEVTESVKFNVSVLPGGSTLLETNVCPTTLAGIFSLYFTILILVILLFFAWTSSSAPIGFLAGLGLLFAGYTHVGCSQSIGMILSVIGFVCMIWFLFMKSN